jgi:hypothetical protein
MATHDRAAVASALAAAAGLDGWRVYAEPPETLTGPRCVVVAPRSPYITWGTYGTADVHLAVSVLVLRAKGPTMDMIEAGLDGVRDALIALEGVMPGDVSELGLVTEAAGVQYVAATMDVELT